MESIELSEEQVLYFRARRGHLAGPGAADAAASARAIIGAQAQQLAPALLALSLRTRGRPTSDELEQRIFGASRSLVRTWGQRDTLHLYDARSDWRAVVAARESWSPGGRGGPLPPEDAVDRALAVMHKAPGPITRADLVEMVPAGYVEALRERAEMAGMDARRLAAARLLWRLSQRGDASMAQKIGAEQAYAARSDWFSDLPWAAERDGAVRSETALARRYLALHGPATATDLAHFFGARVSSARDWLRALEPELAGVVCGARRGLLALAADLDELRSAAPRAERDWPLRLLPMWESMLMAHADKSWTMPDASERKQVWGKAAQVAAVALARGRVVATWRMRRRARRLKIELRPLGAWRRSKHGAALRREGKAVAAHLGLEGVEVVGE